MPIAVFVTNTVIVQNNVTIIDCSGSGPIRLVETADTWRIVAVDGGDIVSTLFEIDKTAADNATDRNTPLFRIKDER